MSEQNRIRVTEQHHLFRLPVEWRDRLRYCTARTTLSLETMVYVCIGVVLWQSRFNKFGDNLFAATAEQWWRICVGRRTFMARQLVRLSVSGEDEEAGGCHMAAHWVVDWTRLLTYLDGSIQSFSGCVCVRQRMYPDSSPPRLFVFIHHHPPWQHADQLTCRLQ